MSIKQAQLESYARAHCPAASTSPIGTLWLSGFYGRKQGKNTDAYKQGAKARIDSGLWVNK